VKKFLLISGLLFFSIVAGLVISEIMVRVIHPQQLISSFEGMYIVENTTFHQYARNVNMIINTGDGPTHFRTDDLGYRINHDEDPAISDAEAELSILTIGDSFMAGLAVENNQTIPEVLAQLLEGKYGVSVNAVNAGVSFRDPNQYYMEARRSLELKQYELGIVFMYVGNDCIARIDTTVRNIIVHKTPDRLPAKIRHLIKTVISSAQRFLEGESHLFILLKHQLYLALPKFGKTLTYLPRYFFTAEEDSTVWEVTTNLAEIIQAEFERNDTPMFFVLIPTIYQTNEELFYDYMEYLNKPPDSYDLERPNKLLAVSFAKRGLRIVDPLTTMRQQADQGIELNGMIDRHFNRNGHRALAEYIFPTIEEYIVPLLEDKSPIISN
jgi:lysophospholipase L1-like esterase